MARRKKEKSQKIKDVVKEAAETYEQIKTNRKEVKKNEPDIIKLVERIVDSLENKKKLDILAYDALTRQFPQTKNTLTELISEIRLFSIYDDEPHLVNFDYSAYLKQIEELANIS